tara:strand:+ start:1120 stop:1395 length:276 start_codon:yes stop_codon:yes gene_type:complete
MGFMCISPILAALSISNLTLTIGSDETTANHINSFGSQHQSSHVSEVIIDEKNKIVSTAAYMENTNIVELHKSIKTLVSKVGEFIKVAINA